MLFLEFQCFSCAYSTNGNLIKTNSNIQTYVSDKSCMNPKDGLTSKRQCNKACIEYAKNQTLENGNTIGLIVRDCLDVLDPSKKPILGSDETNQTCFTDLCNVKQFSLPDPCTHSSKNKIINIF